MLQPMYIVLLILAASIFVIAQKSSDSFNIVNAKSNACEQNSLEIDILGGDTSKTKERMFVIARAGRTETETVNLRRLQKLRQFLEERKGWKNLDVVYARGERMSVEGQIEFYVGSKLRLIIKAGLNHTPCMDCCGPDVLANPRNLLRRSSKKVPH